MTSFPYLQASPSFAGRCMKKNRTLGLFAHCADTSTLQCSSTRNPFCSYKCRPNIDASTTIFKTTILAISIYGWKGREAIVPRKTYLGAHLIGLLDTPSDEFGTGSAKLAFRVYSQYVEAFDTTIRRERKSLKNGTRYIHTTGPLARLITFRLGAKYPR